MQSSSTVVFNIRTVMYMVNKSITVLVNTAQHYHIAFIVDLHEQSNVLVYIQYQQMVFHTQRIPSYFMQVEHNFFPLCNL